MPHGLTLCVDLTPRNVSGIGRVTHGQGQDIPLLYLNHVDWEAERLRTHGQELIQALPPIRKPSLTCWKSTVTQVGRQLTDTRPDRFRPLEIDIERSVELSAAERLCMRYLLTALAAADSALLRMKTSGIVMAQVGQSEHGQLVMQFIRSDTAKSIAPNPKPASIRRHLSFS